MPKLLALACALLAAPAAWATCYEVYRGEALVYRSTQTPVDLSQPLHETVPRAFGKGASLRFFPDIGPCPNEDARRRAPLLTNDEVGRAFGRAGAPARDLDAYFRDRQ